MPRANRYIIPGRTYHLTHRCHNRAFLLKFERDREAYRNMLRERLTRYRVSLLTYCITSNHVHLLVHADRGRSTQEISDLMQCLEGDFAQHFNLRKRRNGAFWGDRYHATMIDGGEYLWSCVKYIDLNMVRAGVVKHPREWAWTGYQELMALRTRYRVVDQERLLELLGGREPEEFRKNYEVAIQEAVNRHQLERDAKWTESLAVGCEAFVKEVGRQIRNRMGVELVDEQSGDGTWLVREAQAAYSSFSG